MKDKRVTIDTNKEIIDPLEKIILSDKQVGDVVINSAVGTLATSIPVFGKMIEYLERVNQSTKEEKLKILLQKYNSHFKSVDETIASLNFLVKTRSGQILFSKIIQILDSETEEGEWIALLANILKNISDSKIEERFKERAYILAQVDRLTPQGLIVLSKYEIWKMVSLSGSSTTSKHTILGDWDSQAANFLAANINITDSMIKLRIGHSFLELESVGLIFLEGSQIKLSIIGAEVYRLTH
jgi:hypothetical protein